MNEKNIKFKPFENDSQSITIGDGESNGITLENGTENIIIYGDYEISKNGNPEEIDQMINILTDIKKQLKPKM